MATDQCEWTLDLCIRARLSIREARLSTRNRLTIIAGRNGCGKSQLLVIIHSFKNTGDQYLQDMGYRNYFLKQYSSVEITGPERIYYIHPARIIGKDPEERTAGPYSFEELQKPFDFGGRYNRFRQSISRLAYDAVLHPIRQVRETRTWILQSMQKAFAELFLRCTLYVDVDQAKQFVSVFARSSDMGFIRPDDPDFELLVPFATLSDGEMNTLYLLYEILFHSYGANTRALVLVDELENHLHPQLQQRFIRVLDKLIPQKSMVLATTHSPIVIGAARPESRILMVHSADLNDNGKLYSNQLLTIDSRTPVSRMLYDLYGAQSSLLGASLLHQVHDVSTAEVVPYAEECLLQSDVKDVSRPSDPQRSFLTGFIHGLRSSNRDLHVLDIGTGTGREIKGLRQDFADPQSQQAITFDLVDPSEERREQLQRLADRNNVISIGEIYERIQNVPSEPKYEFIFAPGMKNRLFSRRSG